MLIIQVALLLLGNSLHADASQPKVFGIGLSKTGTTSLGLALEALGFNNIHMDRAFVPFLYPEGVYDFSGIRSYWFTFKLLVAVLTNVNVTTCTITTCTIFQ